MFWIFFVASQFSSQPVIGTGLAHLAYGVLFPGAFVAVVYTGTELFTGNTVTMIMLVCNDGWRAMHHLVRVWIASCFGNLAGAVFGSFFISYLSGAFQKGLARTFLFVMTKSKLEHNFGQALILGVGCNALVCLATWCVVCSDDGAGKILAMFYSIGVFAMGGFEHVVANFYTLTTAAIHGYKEHTFGQIVVNNWIPVLLGNILAGTMFTGVLWWYALHPSYSDLAAFSNKELSVELSQRCAAPPTPVFDSTYINQQHDAAKPAENAPRWYVFFSARVFSYHFLPTKSCILLTFETFLFSPVLPSSVRQFYL